MHSAKAAARTKTASAILWLDVNAVHQQKDLQHEELLYRRTAKNIELLADELSRELLQRRTAKRRIFLLSRRTARKSSRRSSSRRRIGDDVMISLSRQINFQKSFFDAHEEIIQNDQVQFR